MGQRALSAEGAASLSIVEPGLGQEYPQEGGEIAGFISLI